MSVLVAGDSHLARPVRAGWRISPDATSVALGGAVATDLPGQLAGLDPSAYDVVVVSIGTNDAGWRDVPLAEFTGAIGWLVDWAGATPVLLMTSPGCDEASAAGHWSNTRLTEYADAAAALVEAAGGRVFDTPAALAPLGAGAFVEDGFHLTAAAYDLLLPELGAAARDLARTESTRARRPPG